MPALTVNATACLNDAARGLAQQMVFWGHDVRHPGGNGLVRFGLERRASTGLSGTSCYSMEWEDGRIELHGAVVSWTRSNSENGSIFCRDAGRIEIWQGAVPPVPGHDRGVNGTAAERWEAFRPFIRWLISYERWILEEFGPVWRAGCWKAIKRLPTGKTWLPPDRALRWWELAATSAPPRAKEFQKN